MRQVSNTPSNTTAPRGGSDRQFASNLAETTGPSGEAAPTVKATMDAPRAINGAKVPDTPDPVAANTNEGKGQPGDATDAKTPGTADAGTADAAQDAGTTAPDSAPASEGGTPVGRMLANAPASQLPPPRTEADDTPGGDGPEAAPGPDADAAQVGRPGAGDAMTGPARTPDAPLTLEAKVANAVDDALAEGASVETADDVSALPSEEIAKEAFAKASGIGAGALLDRPRFIEIDQRNFKNSKDTIAAIRLELQRDGASEAQIDDFDRAVNKAALQGGFDVAEDPRFDFASLKDREQEFLDIFAELADARSERIDPPLNVDPTIVPALNKAVAGAIADDGQTPFEGGDLTLITKKLLAEIGTDTASDLARGILEGDADAVQTAQQHFGAVRQEAINRGAQPAEITMVNDSFGSLVEADLGLLQSGASVSTTRDVLEQESFKAFKLAVEPNDPYVNNVRIKNVSSFEGTNGAEPVSIFTVENNDALDTGSGASHSAGVENVIEEQLQDAGQGYTLTNLQIRGATVPAALSQVADAAPDFANVSLGDPYSPQIFTRLFQEIDGEGLDVVAGLDLTVPVTVDNIGDYADAIRTIALDVETYEPFIDENFIPILDELGSLIEGYEAVAAAGTNIFVAIPNSATGVGASQFASDEGLAGSITNVGNIGILNSLDTDTFWLPDDTLPSNDLGMNGIPTGRDSSFYRGDLVDAFAPGNVPFGLNGTGTGTSFASPDMLVNAVLGTFDPATEQRVSPT